MNKLLLSLESYELFDNEFVDYLLSLDGVNKVEINKDKKEVYIEYDSNTIELQVLKMEILYYLKLKLPSINSFNKYIDGKEHTIVIKDLCCEYCLMSMIEDLLDKDGILSASHNYDNYNKNNVNIFITYDETKIDNEELNKIDEEFNNYGD